MTTVGRKACHGKHVQKEPDITWFRTPRSHAVTPHPWFCSAWLKISSKPEHTALQQELFWCPQYNSLNVRKVQSWVDLFLTDHPIPIPNSFIPLLIQHMEGTEIQEGLWNTESDVNSIVTNENYGVHYFLKA